MLKRLCLLLAAVIAPGLFLGQAPLATAATGSTVSAPPTTGGWEGLPDLYGADVSPRFLTVSGDANFTIPGAAAKNVLRLTFTPAGPTDRVQVRVYDANYGGKWDQRVDNVFVNVAPETRFEVYADPNDGGAATLANPVNRIATLLSSTVPSDQVWTELIDLPAADAAIQKGFNATEGRYHFLVKTELVIDANSTGYEINGYKIAFNGTYILPANQVLGFTGGAIDALGFIGAGNTISLLSRDLVNNNQPNAYYVDTQADPNDQESPVLKGGSFVFPFDPSSFCGDLKASNGDADWTASTVAGVVPTGVPPDDGGPYLNPQQGGAGVAADATAFKVSPAIQFQFLRPNGSTSFDSLTAAKSAFTPVIPPADPSSHPSIDQAQQGGPDAPFQSMVMAEAELRASPGRWGLRWTGVDAHNSVFIKFDKTFGTTPRPQTLTGRLFCDGNGNNAFDAGETVLAGVPLKLREIGTQVDVKKQTGPDGTYSFDVQTGKTYELDLDGAVCATPKLPLPRVVGPQFCDPVNLPFTCTYTASGHVFCDGNLDKIFNAGDTPLAGNVTVRLELQGTAEFVEVQSTGTTWSAPNLKPGTWNAFVKAGQLTDALTKTSTQPQSFTLDAATCSKSGIDFGYVCSVSLCVNLFCDYDGDCELTQGDTPLDGVDVTAQLLPGGQLVTKKTANGGRVCFDAPPGSYAIVIAPVPGATIKNPPAGPVLVGNQDVELFFCYECLGRLCGTVYLNKPNCDLVYTPATDEELQNVRVNLWTSPRGGAPIDTTLTQADGSYCFVDRRAGTYEVEVAPQGQQPTQQLVNLTPTTPVLYVPVLPMGGSVEDLDFGYCAKARIHGKVFKEFCTNTCDGVIDPNVVPLVGVRVDLTGGPSAPKNDFTDGNGDYSFENLEPGQYTVTVQNAFNQQQQFFVNLTPTSNVSVPTVLASGDDVMVNFPWCSCAPARVFGYVYKNPLGACDCTLDPNDTRLGGIKVTLTGSTSEGVLAAETLTNEQGFYEFPELPAPGTYTVTIDGLDPQLVNLSPNSAAVVGPFQLAPGGERRVDWCFCTQRIHGYVYKNPPCDCDGEFDDGDTPLVGVRVTAVRQEGDALFLLEDFTDANGHYEFADIKAGTYTVQVDGQDPQVVDLTPDGDVSVGPFGLSKDEDRRIDFGFCWQRACGLVFREPPCDCDGRYVVADGDLPVVGATVELTFTSGPRVGDVLTTTTGDDGRWCFDNLPLGAFEVTVPEQPAVAGLHRSTDAVLTGDMSQGCRYDFDFGWCMPGETKLCAKVFCEPKGECDGTFDEGRDEWMPWIEVFVAVAGDNDGYLKSGFTGADGRVCFEGLPAGDYVIYVGSHQPALKGYKPSTPNCYRVRLDDCERACAPFGWCKTCVPTPCCEGDLREVTVGTAFWVGSCPRKLELSAILTDGCGCGCGTQEIDRLSLSWRAHLAAEAVGANDVLRLVNVKVKDGVAYVVLKLTAQGPWFQDGAFGRRELGLKVTLNGVTHRACAKLRCESFRPGLYFTWGKGQSLPECKLDGWRWDGVSCWSAPWLSCGWRSAARFLVLDTKSKEAYDCGACSRCTECTACPTCTELLPEKDGPAHHG